MCMHNAIKIDSKDVPKYAYKIYERLDQTLSTFFLHAIHDKNNFNKSDLNKKTHKTIRHVPSALHFGRISVYINKEDAIDFCDRRSVLQCDTWKVEIKQTTKYAYKGNFRGKTLAVDQVKPIKRVY